MHRILLTLVASISLACLAPAAQAQDHGGANGHLPEATHAADAQHADPVHAGADHAGGHGDPNPVAFDLIPLFATLIMFGIVFFVLNAKVWPVITKALNDRAEKITKEIGDAEAASRNVRYRSRALQCPLSVLVPRWTGDRWHNLR